MVYSPTTLTQGATGFKRFAYWAGVLSLATAMLGLSAPTRSAAAPVAGVTCHAVDIIAFRGSGEGNLDPKVKDPAGESHDYGDGVVTNGWEGSTLARLVASYIEQVKGANYSDGFKPDSFPIYGVGPTNDNALKYGAVAAWKELAFQVLNSALDGVDAASELADTLRAEAKTNGCPPPKFIAIGYSQGAMAARQFAGYPDVVGVLDLGDPEQSPFALGNEGTGSKGEGVIRFKYPNLKPVFDSYDNDSLEDKIALCHKDDPICDFQFEHSGRLLSPIQHTNYLTTPEETAVYGKKLAEMAHKHFVPAGTTPTDSVSSRVGLDTMISIDTTGSMQPYLNAAVASAEAIARKSLSAAQHARVGLVEYRDHSVDSFGARTVVPLTSDIDALKKGLASLKADGGGDTPEDVYSGIVTALGADWNPIAARSIVVLGDAPPHDPELGTCYTAVQITRLLAGVTVKSSVPPPNSSSSSSSSPCSSRTPSPSPTVTAPSRTSSPTPFTSGTPSPSSSASSGTNRVSPTATPTPTNSASATAVSPTDPVVGEPVSLYGLSGGDDFTAELKEIAKETGGQILETKDAATAGDRIIAALEDAASSPEASLTTISTSFVGSRAVVSAAGSHVEKGSLKYEYDLDGDGVFETSSVSPTVTHTFEKEGDITMAVRVTGDKGRTSLASQVVHVLPQASAAPRFTEASSIIQDVQLSPETDAPGTNRRLLVGGLQPGEQVIAQLVGPQQADPYTADSPIASVGPASGQIDFPVPATVQPGVYRILVFTTQGRHAYLDITVESPWAFWILWIPVTLGAIALLAAVLWIRRVVRLRRHLG